MRNVEICSARSLLMAISQNTSFPLSAFLNVVVSMVFVSCTVRMRCKIIRTWFSTVDSFRFVTRLVLNVQQTLFEGKLLTL
jgi:hypothetical protein